MSTLFCVLLDFGSLVFGCLLWKWGIHKAVNGTCSIMITPSPESDGCIVEVTGSWPEDILWGGIMCCCWCIWRCCCWRCWCWCMWTPPPPPLLNVSWNLKMYYCGDQNNRFVWILTYPKSSDCWRVRFSSGGNKMAAILSGFRMVKATIFLFWD